MMRDHIDRMKTGLAQIRDGMDQLRGGPASFTLDVLFAAYRTLTTQYAPFTEGQRVALDSAPKLHSGHGWWHCRHFLTPDNLATVRYVTCDSQGQLRFDVVFDRETWLDRDGVEQPVDRKSLFSFFAHDLVSAQPVQP